MAPRRTGLLDNISNPKPPQKPQATEANALPPGTASSAFRGMSAQPPRGTAVPAVVGRGASTLHGTIIPREWGVQPPSSTAATSAAHAPTLRGATAFTPMRWAAQPPSGTAAATLGQDVPLPHSDTQPPRSSHRPQTLRAGTPQAQGAEKAPTPSSSGITYIPQSTLKKIRFNYWGGYRYKIQPKSATTEHIKLHRAFYIGISKSTICPVVIKKDNIIRGNPADSSRVSGVRSGVKLIDAKTGRYCTHFVPTLETLRQGRVQHLKDIILGKAPLPENGDWMAKGAEMADALLNGLPVGVARDVGFPETARIGESVVEKELHPAHSPVAQREEQFFMPVFRLVEKEVPARATEILEQWMADHPRDLLYMQVALAKVMQWIWVVTDKNLRDDGAGGAVPFVSLSEWLKCAHLYESFHQAHELTSYLHPFRFVNRMMREHHSPFKNYPDDTPNYALEELVIILYPLAAVPMGFIIPSSLKGSSMPDLASMGETGCLGRDSALLATTNQPDCRSLYWTTTPLWEDFARNVELGRNTSNIRRDLGIHFSWVPPPVREKLHLLEDDDQPILSTPGKGTHSGCQTVLDVHPHEPTPRLEPLFGPIHLRGKRETHLDSTILVADLQASFAEEQPRWAIRGPEGTNDLAPILKWTVPPSAPAMWVAATLSDQDEPPPMGRTPRPAPARFQGLPPMPGQPISLPLGMMTAMEVLSPCQIEWLKIHLGARLEWARARGMTADDMTISPRTGLIELPGLENLDFIPPEVGLVSPDPVLAEDESLWNDFLEVVEKTYPKTSKCWAPLVDFVHRYLTEPEQFDKGELDEAAVNALRDFFTSSVPVALALRLVKTGGVGNMKGQSGNGKITMAMVRTSLVEILGKKEKASITATMCVSLADEHPEEFLAQLEALVDECQPADIPPIFHHKYGNDEATKQGIADHLEDLFGTYNELDFMSLLHPVPGVMDRGEPPAKRPRLDRPGSRSNPEVVEEREEMGNLM